MAYISLDVQKLKQANSDLESSTNELVGTHFSNLQNCLTSLSSNIKNQGINGLLIGINNKLDTISTTITNDLKKITNFMTEQTTEYERSEDDILNRINAIITKVQQFNNVSTSNGVGIFNNSAVQGQTNVSGGVDQELDSWIKELEGTKPTTTINGEKYYKAYADNGTYAASNGVQVIDNNGNKYLSSDSYIEKDGSIYVKQSAVDNLYNQEVSAKKDRVISAANSQNVSLNEEQVNAMTSYVYRTGTGKNQAEDAMAAYASGGNEALRAEMYSHRNKGNYEAASVKRMAAEYILFTEGTYTDNPYDMSYQEALEIMTG